jgi:hypothetical protein
MIEIRGQRRRGPPKRAPKNVFTPGAKKKKKRTVPAPTAPKNISSPSTKKGKYVPAYGSKSTTLSRNRFRGGEGYNAEINEEQCLWKIDGFEIVNTNKGVRLKAYYEDDSDKKIPYPLIDISKWEMQKEIHWEEIFRSNVEVLITNLWREEYWGDVRRLEKNDIVIYVRFYADNRLVFYLESMG